MAGRRRWTASTPAAAASPRRSGRTCATTPPCASCPSWGTAWCAWHPCRSAPAWLGWAGSDCEDWTAGRRGHELLKRRGCAGRFAGPLLRRCDNPCHLATGCGRPAASCAHLTCGGAGKLYEPATGRMAGLQPTHFISIATPHLGCRGQGPSQMPFMRWFSALPPMQQAGPWSCMTGTALAWPLALCCMRRRRRVGTDAEGRLMGVTRLPPCRAAPVSGLGGRLSPKAAQAQP